MKYFLSLILMILIVNCQPKGFLKEVNNFRVYGQKVNVYFIDPFDSIMKNNPDFENYSNDDKYEILHTYLGNNPVYIFRLRADDNKIKYYILRGNPKKLRTKYYFQLDIVRGDKDSINFFDRESYKNQIENTIDKIEWGGSFFEHMKIFDNVNTAKLRHIGFEIWGYYTMIESYPDLQEVVKKIINYDISSKIPEEILKKDVVYEPMFEYQKCAIENVKARFFHKFTCAYDSIGTRFHYHERVEKDYDLLYSSTTQELGGISAFPFFTSGDTLIKIFTDSTKEIFSIKPSQEFLKYYLKDIELVKDKISGNIVRINAKLIVHVSSLDGDYTFDKYYTADFGKVKNCWLPLEINYYEIDDTNKRWPVFHNDIEYFMKE